MLPDYFYLVNFLFAIVISSISLIVSISTIVIVYKTRQFHTFNNILICNTALASILYCLVSIIASIYGLDGDGSYNSTLCSIRGYCFNIGVSILCYSKSIHAISRLFFSIFYKHRYLLTWRTHRILIGFNWIIGLIVCIPPFFIRGGYGFEFESRSCVISTKMYILALYIAIVSCIIPFNIIAIVYTTILFHVHRSTRRVWAIRRDGVINPRDIINKNKREMKLMKQMIIQTGILLGGGPIFLFLIGWHAITDQPPPEFLYLLAFNLMTLVASLAPIVQFIMNKQLKQFIITFFYRRQRIVTITKPLHRPQQAWHIT